jgi:hypothetical protein
MDSLWMIFRYNITLLLNFQAKYKFLQIFTIFSRCGKVEHTYVTVNKTGTNFFAIVQMATYPEAARAVHFIDNTIQFGCRIRVIL